MTIRLALIIWLAFFTVAEASAPHCSKGDAPTIIKPMENWDIIATNIGTIAMATVFSGNKLTYTISAHPKNSKNKVSINMATGAIQIKAERKDDFDVTVKVKNLCGTASNTFNVVIDEEE